MAHGEYYILALIPARSGSKGVKHKNILSLHGRPLLSYSIDHALKSSYISSVIVSTDSEYYAEIARNNGAEVPFIRPEKFAGDEATDLEVFIHALEFLRERDGRMPDICVHLRPTSPIRDADDIDAMIRMLIDNPGIDSVRSISEAVETPYKMWSMDENHRIRPIIQCGIRDAYNMPRQSLPKVYVQNASIDVVRTSTILDKRSMTGDVIYGYEIQRYMDIDTIEQFETASRMLTRDNIQTSGKTYCFDMDGVIASLSPDCDYIKAIPLTQNIALINTLFEMGNQIVIHTARGFVTGRDWHDTTTMQLERWGVKYHDLHMGKPAADYYIDDRMITIAELSYVINRGGNR